MNSNSLISMKKLFYSAIVLAALASCKSTKNADCDAYGQNALQRNLKKIQSCTGEKTKETPEAFSFTHISSKYL